jgi:hypothetical protein
VPRRGLEPPRSYPLVPETSASTNSATWAGTFSISALLPARHQDHDYSMNYRGIGARPSFARKVRHSGHGEPACLWGGAAFLRACCCGGTYWVYAEAVVSTLITLKPHTPLIPQEQGASSRYRLAVCAVNDALWRAVRGASEGKLSHALAAICQGCSKRSRSSTQPSSKRQEKSRLMQDQAAFLLVPRRGLEPPRSYPLVPETSASTNSATWAGTLYRCSLLHNLKFVLQ